MSTEDVEGDAHRIVDELREHSRREVAAALADPHTDPMDRLSAARTAAIA